MKPTLRFLDDDLVVRIVAEGRTLLAELGVLVQDQEVLELLADHGGRVDFRGRRAYLDDGIIDSALGTVPQSFDLFDVSGGASYRVGGERVHFVPGSAGMRILGLQTGKMRRALSRDYATLGKLVSGLTNLSAQSTSVVPSDVPEAMSDSYRLFLCLLFCNKPVVTGAFTVEGFQVMKELQLAVRGTAGELASRPFTIFSCCATSPLRWCETTSRILVDCARAGIPVELISMPLAGFMAPVTLVGSLILHTAETLSGIVISQLARPGAPLLYGGSSAPFDYRYETTPMGAPESMMLACGHNEIGRYLGVPTQAYISLSDSRRLDAQAGLETSMGATVAVLAGIHHVSGPGMLDFENCISFGKLVLDNEICGLALRLSRGIHPRDDFPALPLIRELLEERHLLISDHTRKHLKAEYLVPGPVIDRSSRTRWIRKGSQTLHQRASGEADRLIANWEPPPLAGDVRRELTSRMKAAASRQGLEELPGFQPV